MSSQPYTFWKSLPGPEDITIAELPNGITVLARSNFSSPSVVMSGYLSAGCVLDPPDKLGLAYFTAISLMRGTQKHKFTEIFEMLESAGASLSIGASVHTTSFGGRSLNEDLPLLLHLLSESLRYPTFPTEYIERLRSQILTGLAIRAQDTSEMSSLIFDQLLFADHPYSQPEDGFPETIQRISREDLVNFHRAQFGPLGLVIAIVGGVEPEDAVDQVRAALGDWENPISTHLPEFGDVNPPAETIRRDLAIGGKSQTDLIMGTVGPRRISPDYLPASLGNNILGQFGMMGRIGELVREKSGLAYHASANLNAWLTAGSWEISAGVNPANLEKTIALIQSELRRFIEEPVTQTELEDSQSQFIGRLPLSLESNAGVAHALLKMYRFELGMDYYQRYPGLIQSITPEMVLEVSRKYWDTDKLIIVSAGPETEPGKAG